MGVCNNMDTFEELPDFDLFQSSCCKIGLIYFTNAVYLLSVSIQNHILFGVIISMLLILIG